MSAPASARRVDARTTLVLAALVSSPATWQAWEGRMPVDVALTRYLAAVAACWLLLAVLLAMVLPAPTAPSRVPTAGTAPVPDQQPAPDPERSAT